METIATLSSNDSSEADCGFAGTLKNIQLHDLIQMCCLSGTSLSIRITKDIRRGNIFIINGQIIHAACGNVEGEEAFYQILGWQTGNFESYEISTVPDRTINKNYNFLIMEAARRADESAEMEPDLAPDIGTGSSEEMDDCRLRVLIVDDSPMMQKILYSLFNSSNLINVVGMVGNGKEAIACIDALSPDLVTLDVNMPVMDGTSAIKHIMIKKPCPVVIMSNPGEGSQRAIFNFLELGAVDFVSKPTRNKDILIQQQNILERIQTAATAKISNFRIMRIPGNGHSESLPAVGEKSCKRLVVVITGPGGHPEQMQLLHALLPVTMETETAVVALQGLPPDFRDALAGYLQEKCHHPVKPLAKKTTLFSGGCYVGINGCPLTVETTDSGEAIVSNDTKTGTSPMDHFLHSAAAAFKEQLTVVLLSGADTGELSGLGAVSENRGRIIVRNRASGIVSKTLDKVADSGIAFEEVPMGVLPEMVVNGFGSNQ